MELFLSLSEKHCFSPSYCGSIVHISHISINYFIFKIPAVRINCYIDCRSKMNSLIFVSKLILRDVWSFFFPLENFSLIWRPMTSPLPVKGYKDPCLALRPIEQWGFFRMPDLLWHEASVYNGHLRGPVTLALIAVFCRAFGSWAVTTCFYD